jgi:hypothetical protein
LPASYFQRNRARSLRRELSAVQNRIRKIRTPGMREVNRLERAGKLLEAGRAYEEMDKTLHPLLKEETRLERQIDEAERWL